MEKKEIELFKALCSFKNKRINEELLNYATPEVLGHLFFNRMQAAAYGVLKENNLLGKVNREFRNSLKGAYEQNIEKNNSFFWCIKHVGDILSECNCKYAMLKGAFLCKSYPDGYRTSNDIDLLVLPKDVTEIGNALLSNGFKQGNVRNGNFIPATRKEIIESKMMRGETVPYIKEVNMPGMQFLEVDINFSLDYKNGDTKLLKEMLDNSEIKDISGLKVKTLREDDFFIHLCTHLYKEATTLPWVEMMRDMTLYKYADIYIFLNDANKEKIDFIFDRAMLTETEKICAFAVFQMAQLFNFDNDYALKKAVAVLKTSPEFIHMVISPIDNKFYIFNEKNIETRFFAKERKKLLKEVM